MEKKNVENFDCDWLIELSDNNLASEVVENINCFFKPVTIKEIANPMIKNKSSHQGYLWKYFAALTS